METKNEKSAIPDELFRRYTEFRCLGSGAMGEVYRAHDSNLDIDVAIKLLKMRQIAPEMAVRFQQEAKVASKLKHHNLVTLLDFGISEKGEPYIIMESVQGHSLAEELEKHGALSISEAVNVMVQVCDGMEHAHRSGIVHRDLKPSNVMVCGDDLNKARIKVLDFGIAKLDDTNGSITRTGTIMGTPYYMSPEQFSGENVDRRTDVYAAGTMLFRLLTNHHPFEGESLLEIMQDKQNYEAPLITESPGGEEIPPEVEEVISRAIARDPDERYASMKEFQEAMFLALDKIHIKLEKQAEPTPEKKTLFNATMLRNSAKVAGLFMMSILTITVLFSVYFYFNKVPLVGVVQPIRSEAKEGTPITDKVFFVANGEWKAKGLVYDRDLEWLANHYADPSCSTLTLGEAQSTETQKNITKRGWAALGRIPFKKLILVNCFVNDSDVKLILKNQNLRALDLSRTGVGDSGVAFLENSKIEELWLHGTPVTDKCIDILATMPNIKKLSVNETAITDKGYEKISKLKKIEWLDLASTHGTAEGLRYIGQMPRLDVLYIGGCPLGLKGLKNLSRLKLKYLNTSHDKTIDDQCFITISKLWPNLETLHVENTSITGKGLKCVGNFKHMKILNLNANALTDEDIRPLLEMPAIEKVDLMLNAITDKSLERLATIPSLGYLDLSHCPAITKKGLKLLKDRKIGYTEVSTEGKDTAQDVMTDLLHDGDTF